MDFSVIPFDPELPRLEFYWYVDDEVEADRYEDMLYTFDSEGIHTVTAIVHDRAEVDTVIWTVTVVEPEGIDDGADVLLPTDVKLYPVVPNPFNSTTSIRYFLPISGVVRLSIYDTAGRLVQALVDGRQAAGNHFVTLHGRELSAGVYLMRLEVDSVIKSQKTVLLK